MRPRDEEDRLAWLATLACGGVERVPGGELPPVVKCSRHGEVERVIFAIREVEPMTDTLAPAASPGSPHAPGGPL